MKLKHSSIRHTLRAIAVPFKETYLLVDDLIHTGVKRVGRTFEKKGFSLETTSKISYLYLLHIGMTSKIPEDTSISVNVLWVVNIMLAIRAVEDTTDSWNRKITQFVPGFPRVFGRIARLPLVGIGMLTELNADPALSHYIVPNCLVTAALYYMCTDSNGALDRLRLHVPSTSSPLEGN